LRSARLLPQSLPSVQLSWPEVAGRKKACSILSDCPADRVTFSNNRVTGILLNSGQHILATHEVIVSAGVILSPATLQRSGIGPSPLLQRYGITPLVELPASLSAYDHPCIPIVTKPRLGSHDKEDYSLEMHSMIVFNTPPRLHRPPTSLPVRGSSRP
jgi:choline dehydrogenase-like flavoprotein